MITNVLSKIFGNKNSRELKKLQPIVDKINSLEPVIEKLTDEQLTEKTAEFKKMLSEGKTLDDILPEAFAVVRETSKRILGQRHYDVQLIGGIILHQGKIAEMKTGEGKTLTSTLPLYLNALTGKGVNLVTVNDYLAKRDAQWMKPIFDHLNITVGVLQNSMSDEERKKAYQADILYATNNELGFDYLKDNMKFRAEDYVQRGLNYAIVDEVDSILIDEARTPLIISGSADKSSELYKKSSQAISTLIPEDYEIDEKAKSVQLTESGIDKLEEFFNVSNLYAIDNIGLLHHLTQALKARTLFKRDVDYVVRDNQVLIVDEFTGRILAGRRYSDGLHQSLEAKENVEIERESQTLASITLQNFFRLYDKLAGMTGTAVTEAEEFHKIYNLDVMVIPTNEPMIRVDKSDMIFLTQAAKYKAIAEDIKERYRTKQPVLIGTVAIEQSEILSNLLTSQGIPHEVLNAKQHQREAEIVAHAGEPGHITIATNMAGRGTDIKLSPESKEKGGLYILGTERHESRRIDNQLRGRSGRQGDVGESRFYISLEDDLIRKFIGDNIKKTMERFGMEEDQVIESKYVSKNIESSQEKVEKHNFEIREHLIKYDDVLNQQRTVIYDYRKELLSSDELQDTISDIIKDTVEDIVYHNVTDKALTNDMVSEIVESIHKLSGIEKDKLESQNFNQARSVKELISNISKYLIKQYQDSIARSKENNVVNDEQKENSVLEGAHKWLMLETIDNAWKQHMLNLEHLKEGIGLRGWGQKDPLIEYKREAFAMFEDMMKVVRQEIVHNIFHLNIHHFNQQELEHKRQQELDEINQIGASQDSEEHEQAQSNKVGRNEDCPCNSGKKYKKCCGQNK